MNPKICRRSQFCESKAVSKMKLEQLLTLTLSNTVAFTANNVNCSETVQSGTAHQCMYMCSFDRTAQCRVKIQHSTVCRVICQSIVPLR